MKCLTHRKDHRKHRSFVFLAIGPDGSMVVAYYFAAKGKSYSMTLECIAMAKALEDGENLLIVL